jgi:4-amino-4-deoxy-L-arabinose transferase-like glycosyltransferase
VTRTDYKIAAGFAAGFILLNLFALDRAPLPWLDEVILNDPAKELALHHRFISAVFSDRPIFQERYYWHPPGQQLVTALVYQVFGFGIWQTRVPVVMFGGLAAGALYLLALAAWRDRRAALAGALLFGLDPKVIQVARSGRMDMQSLFLSFVGLIVFLTAENLEGPRRTRRLAAAGLIIGLAGVVHPVAAFWALAVGLLILIAGQPGKVRSLIVFGAASALPVLLWLTYGLSRPEVFFKQFLAHGHIHKTYGGPLIRLANELLRFPHDLKLEPLALIVYAAALPWLALRSRACRQRKIELLVLFLVPFMLNAMFMVKTGGYYYLHPNAIIMILGGGVLAHYLPERLTRPRGWREAGAVIFAVLLLLNLLVAGFVGHYVIWAKQWRARDPAPVKAAVATAVPAGSVVFGPPQAWYAVVEAGSVMRLGKRPDPRRHDYAILPEAEAATVPAGFREVGRAGMALPPVLGKYGLSPLDYRLRIYQSEFR